MSEGDNLLSGVKRWGKARARKLLVDALARLDSPADMPADEHPQTPRPSAASEAPRPTVPHAVDRSAAGAHAVATAPPDLWTTVQQIAELVTDYRQGEIEPITAHHVARWAQQFPAAEQATIVHETHKLLLRFYFSRSRIRDALRQFLRKDVVSGRYLSGELQNTKFLCVQDQGESQRVMLNIVGEILADEYGVALPKCTSTRNFVYIDDGLYTGNRVIEDLKRWLPIAPTGSRVMVYHLAIHERGRGYAERQLGPLAAQRDVSLRFW